MQITDPRFYSIDLSKSELEVLCRLCKLCFVTIARTHNVLFAIVCS